ncbi:MAG: diguanylate cyclase [Lachnospiraceae bacterium]|nr:diguanylate cyclase [Lachnospiraceae bacterium]
MNDYGVLTNLNVLEAKSNRYTVKCQRNSFIILTVVWLLNVFHIFIIDSRLMNISYAISLLITLACYLVCRIGGADKPWIKYVLLLLTVLFSTTVSTFLTYQAVLVAAVPLCYSMQYYERKVVYYTYGLTIVSIFFSTMAGYFYGLCDANMLVLTTGPMAQYVKAGEEMALFDAINTNPWGTLPLYYALPRCMILFAVIIIGSHAVRASAAKEIQEIKLKKLSEIDGMTGLYNKNKYIAMVEKHYPMVNMVGVLFWDADGLKKINDSFGHEVGDCLIRTVGLSIQELCSESRHGYRIGGDEFVLVMENVNEEEVCRVMQEWKKIFARINQKEQTDFHASVGYAVGVGEQIEELVRRADERMYIEKRHGSGR